MEAYIALLDEFHSWKLSIKRLIILRIESFVENKRVGGWVPEIPFFHFPIEVIDT